MAGSGISVVGTMTAKQVAQVLMAALLAIGAAASTDVCRGNPDKGQYTGGMHITTLWRDAEPKLSSSD